MKTWHMILYAFTATIFLPFMLLLELVAHIGGLWLRFYVTQYSHYEASCISSTPAKVSDASKTVRKRGKSELA